MYYISRQRKLDNKYGVVDTDNMVEEFLTPEELLKVYEKLDVLGITGKNVYPVGYPVDLNEIYVTKTKDGTVKTIMGSFVKIRMVTLSKYGVVFGEESLLGKSVCYIFDNKVIYVDENALLSFSGYIKLKDVTDVVKDQIMLAYRKRFGSDMSHIRW